MQRVAPVEVFRDPKGKAVSAGHYSMLVRVVFQSSERTLTDEEIASSYDAVVQALSNLGGVRRA
jgi:phenylalanyl-tRNA synthetase beta chain